MAWGDAWHHGSGAGSWRNGWPADKGRGKGKDGKGWQDAEARSQPAPLSRSLAGALQQVREAVAE